MQDAQTRIFQLTQSITVNKARTADAQFQGMDGYIRRILDPPVAEFDAFVNDNDVASVKRPPSALADLHLAPSDACIYFPFPWTDMFASCSDIHQQVAIQSRRKSEQSRGRNPLVDLDVSCSFALEASPFSWQMSAATIAFVPKPANNARGEHSPDLPQGNAYIDLKAPAKFVAHGATVEVQPGAKVVVMNTDDALGVLTLFDRVIGDVKVTVDGKNVAVAPGEQIVISSKSKEFDRVNPAAGIPYRALNSTSLSRGATLFRCDFSIPSVLSSFDTLRKLRTATDPESRKRWNDVLKVAAIMTKLRTGYGPYRTNARDLSMVEPKPFK